MEQQQLDLRLQLSTKYRENCDNIKHVPNKRLMQVLE